MSLWLLLATTFVLSAVFSTSASATTRTRLAHSYEYDVLVSFVHVASPDSPALSSRTAATPGLTSARTAHPMNLAAEEGGAVSGAFRGGLYKDLEAPERIERHHMIADSVSSLPRGEGPSIQMEVAEHRMTGSWGNSAAARAYRAQQAARVAEGDTAGALQMDIGNVRTLFGPKYDQAILEMLGRLGGG